jgi:hypothetical protein
MNIYKKLFILIRSFLSGIDNPEFRTFQAKIHSIVKKFLTTPSCRRKILLDYFENDIEYFEKNHDDEPKTNLKPNCCDNCTQKLKNKDNESSSSDCDQLKDFTEEALKIFGIIKLINYKFGLTTYILYLMGSVSFLKQL